MANTPQQTQRLAQRRRERLLGAVVAWFAETLDNPYVLRNHRRFASYGIDRLTRMGFSPTDVMQALFWLPRLRNHVLLIRRPPSRASSFRPLHEEEAQLFSDDAFRRVMQMYSLRLLTVHDLEQLLTYIREEDLAPVDTEMLEELLYELFPTYSAHGTPFFAGLPNPEQVQ